MLKSFSAIAEYLLESLLPSLECHVHPLFIVVRGGEGCSWLDKGCHFDTWRIVILSCIWLGLSPRLDTWRHLIGLWYVVTMTSGMSLSFKVKWSLDLYLIKMNLFICKTQVNHSTKINMNLIQILYELNPIKIVCLQQKTYIHLYNYLTHVHI